MAYEDTEDYKNLMKAQAREDADANEPGTESTAAFMKRTGTKANRPKATVGGPRIVTKEELKKSGFTNLRDFLNDERKLKRRDGKPAELKDEKKDKPTKKEEAKESTKQMADDRRVKKLGVFGAKGKNPRPANPSMFKKGGKVSSASKRADGCAKRGKTKCKMV